jgi:hypothetical protein
MANRTHSTTGDNPLPLDVVELDQHPDGALLQAAAAFHRLREEDSRAWKAIPDDKDLTQAHWDWCNSEKGYWTLIDSACERVRQLPARTLEGLRAKALVAETLLLEHHGTQIAENCEGEEIYVAMSLARDILGRVRA